MKSGKAIQRFFFVGYLFSVFIKGLFVRLSVRPSVSLSVRGSVLLSVHPSVSQSVSQPASQSVSQSVSLVVGRSVGPSCSQSVNYIKPVIRSIRPSASRLACGSTSCHPFVYCSSFKRNFQSTLVKSKFSIHSLTSDIPLTA